MKEKTKQQKSETEIKKDLLKKIFVEDKELLKKLAQ